MRYVSIAVVSLFLAPVSLFAQQSSSGNAVSIFMSDASVVESSATGTNFNAGYGLALDHRLTRNVWAELSVTAEQHHRFVTTFATNGVPSSSWEPYRLYPIDALATYHFVNDSRWEPYIGAGVRYVSVTFRGDAPPSLPQPTFTSSSLDTEVSGGVALRLTPFLGLRFDAKQIIGNGSRGVPDRDFKASAGLSWRF